MDKTEELRDIIIATNIEEESILGNLLTIVCLEHPLHVSNDPEIALSEVLRNYLPDVKSATKSYAATKLFRTEKRDVLLPKINIGNLDSGLVLALLLKVDGVLGMARTAGICGNTSHANVCCDDCRNLCDHSSVVCKKCIGNKPSKKCDHKCKHCNKTAKQCEKDSEMCCKACKLCLICNKKLIGAKISKLLCTGAPSTTSISAEPCGFYLFLYCLEVLLKLRNLYAHITTEELNQFLNGNLEPLKGFEMCKDRQQLLKYIQFVFFTILDYMKDIKNFKNFRNPLSSDSYDRHKENLESIHNCGVSLQKYIKNHDYQMKLMRAVIDVVSSMPERFIAEDAKENVERTATNQLGRWRSIYHGVVLKLDIPANDEVKKVVCCKTDNVQGSFVIEHMSCVKDKREPFYETKRIDNTSMVLKIENMEEGYFKIDVENETMVKSFEVEVDYKLSNVSWKIGDMNIQFPSSDLKEFWREMVDIINNCERSNDCKFLWSEGANTRMYTLEKFQEIGIKYFQRNFIDGENVICFRPTSLIDNKTMKSIVHCFEKLLSKDLRTVGEKMVILVSPDLDYHLGMITKNHVSLKKMKRGCEPCLLIFVEQRLLIIIVRIVLDAQMTEDTIDSCQRDSLNFVNINGSKLQKEKINIVGVIACPSIARNDLKDMLPYHFATCQEDLYNKYFLCEDELQLETGEECMNEWWKTVTSTFKRNVDLGNELFYTSLIGPHMASMASVQEGLPTLDDCTHQQLLTLLLNPSQITAVESNDRKKLITGPFGSGKSLVGQRILRKMAANIRNSKKPGMLAYISCDPYSIIDAHIKDIMQAINDDDNITFLCGSMHNLFKDHVDEDTSNASLDVLIKELTTKCENCGFVIDEINEASMTEEVAKNINENLKNSHIVFIQQSIKKVRTYTENHKDHLLEMDHFSLIGNLKRHHLQHVMRLTVQCQQLVDCTQKIIQQETLKVLLPESQNNEPQQSMSVEAANVAIRQLPQNSSEKNELSSKRIPQNTSVRETEVHDLDMSLRYMANSQSLTTSDKIIKTDFGFVDGELGHDIQRKPELYHLPESIPVGLDTIKFLRPILDSFCFQEGENTVCIAHSIESAEVFYRIAKSCKKDVCLYIPYLQRKIPSLIQKEGVIGKIKRNSSVVLITDNHSFIGMEAKNVVTIADPKEKYLRHSIVEIISRCSSNLQVFVPFYDKIEAGTMSEIFKGWKDEQLIHQQLVKVTNIVLDTQKITNRPIATCKKTNDVIVYGKATCITQHNLHQLSSEEQKNFHVQRPENMSNFIHLRISQFQPPRSRIIHHVDVDGKRLSFLDVWMMLERKDFGSFESIVDVNPNIINFRVGFDRDGFDWTLLMLTIIYDRDDIFEYLTSKFTEQIDYIAKNSVGWTVFHHAARYNNINAMNILIAKYRRGLEICDDRGQTPLFHAAYSNRKSMVILLLENGADAHVKDHDDRTADRVIDDYGQDDIVNKDIQIIIRGYQTKNASMETS